MRNEKLITFQPLTTWTALGTLNHPRNAGTYVYGRRYYRRTADGKNVPRKRERDDWLACIPDAHPEYITPEQFQQNFKILETNGRGYEVARASPPREGAALLQARAVCGLFGRHFRLRYATRRGRQEDGISVIAHKALVGSPAASRLQEHALMKQSVRWSPPW